MEIRNNILFNGNEDIIHAIQTEPMTTHDTTILPKSKTTVIEENVGAGWLGVYLVEPIPGVQQKALIAKSLDNEDSKTVPIKVADPNKNSVTLKKEQIIRNCESTVKIIKVEVNVHEMMSRDFTESLMKTW